MWWGKEESKIFFFTGHQICYAWICLKQDEGSWGIQTEEDEGNAVIIPHSIFFYYQIIFSLLELYTQFLTWKIPVLGNDLYNIRYFLTFWKSFMFLVYSRLEFRQKLCEVKISVWLSQDFLLFCHVIFLLNKIT